jgi:hypothetical protein
VLDGLAARNVAAMAIATGLREMVKPAKAMQTLTADNSRGKEAENGPSQCSLKTFHGRTTVG